MTEDKKIKTRSQRYTTLETEEPKKQKTEKTPKQKKKIEKETKEPKEKKEHPRLKKFLIVITTIFLAILLYSTLIGPRFIDIKEYKIESSLLPETFHGIKVIHLSDIHYGTTINQKQLDKIVSKINKFKPDIILFTGDLIDQNIIPTDQIKEELITSLSKLECSLYKYAVYGDEDLNNKVYKEIITSSNFTLLENSSTLLYYKGTTPIMITGYNPIETSPNYTIITDYVDEQDTTNYYKIVLMHEPDAISKFINYNPNLVVSGHTLGGLIKIPFLNPLFLPKNTTQYFEDYYKINNTDFYISNGLGTSKINARLNNHPSINFYRLYKAN